MDINQLVVLPESKTLEFKTNLSPLTSIVKTIVAFANTSGGTLVIGRSPEGVIVGVEDVFEEEERLANVIAESICPKIMPEIEIATVQGRNLLIVKVQYWKGPFYVAKQGVPKGVFVRLGSTSRQAGPELVEELQRVSKHTCFDEQPLLEATQDALDTSRIQQFFAEIQKEYTEEKLFSLGVLKHSSAGVVPSVGGMIFFGKDAFRRKYFPDARVRCARFLGVDKSHILDQSDIEGTILEAIDQVAKFIARNTRLSSEISQVKREDIPEYPSVAIREVLINALVHADYALSGSQILVSIFDDRLEIQNPGMLPFGFTLEDLKSGVSRVRNRVLVRLFKQAHLMEEWGSGYSRVMAVCREAGCRDPLWHELATAVRVVLYPRGARVPQKSEGLSERQQALLVLFKEGGSFSFSQIAEKMSFSISERTLRYDLAHLKQLGLIASTGKARSRVWKLVGG